MRERPVPRQQVLTAASYLSAAGRGAEEQFLRETAVHVMPWWARIGLNAFHIGRNLREFGHLYQQGKRLRRELTDLRQGTDPEGRLLMADALPENLGRKFVIQASIDTIGHLKATRDPRYDQLFTTDSQKIWFEQRHDAIQQLRHVDNVQAETLAYFTARGLEATPGKAIRLSPVFANDISNAPLRKLADMAKTDMGLQALLGDYTKAHLNHFRSEIMIIASSEEKKRTNNRKLLVASSVGGTAATGGALLAREAITDAAAPVATQVTHAVLKGAEWLAVGTKVLAGIKTALVFGLVGGFVGTVGSTVTKNVMKRVNFGLQRDIIITSSKFFGELDMTQASLRAVNHVVYAPDIEHAAPTLPRRRRSLRMPGL